MNILKSESTGGTSRMRATMQSQVEFHHQLRRRNFLIDVNTGTNASPIAFLVRRSGTTNQHEDERPLLRACPFLDFYVPNDGNKISSGLFVGCFAQITGQYSLATMSARH